MRILKNQSSLCNTLGYACGAMLVCLFSCFGTVMGQDTIDLKSLADSVRKANGKPNFLPLGMHFPLNWQKSGRIRLISVTLMLFLPVIIMN